MQEGTDRIRRSSINILFGFVLQIVSILCGFITRKVFISTLGVDLQGVNATLTSIITMLSLSDLGLSFAIYAALYKPIADSNRDQIIAITSLCARLYKIVSCVIFVAGLLLLPFLQVFFNEADLQNIDISYIRWVFLLFLADSSISYLFSYRWVLFNADQNTYIISRANTVYAIALSALQVIIILSTKSYVLYLMIKIACVLIKNLYLTQVAGRKYDYLRHREKRELDPGIKRSIIKNTKALALHRLGNYAITGTDTLIISRFISIATTGAYSNYYMIISSITQVITEFTNGVSASLGNVLVTEGIDKTYKVFKTINFINFIFYNFAATSILVLAEPFITIWLGSSYVLAFDTVILLALNFFNTGVAAPLGTIRANAGLFEPDRYLHILFAVLNLVVSILLVRPLGISGVFIGTLISYVAKEIITLPTIVYKNIFHKSVRSYYKIYFSFLGTCIVSAIVTYGAGNLGVSLIGSKSPFTALIIRAIVCLIIPNAIALALFNRTPEFKDFKTIARNQLRRLLHRGTAGQ